MTTNVFVARIRGRIRVHTTQNDIRFVTFLGVSFGLIFYRIIFFMSTIDKKVSFHFYHTAGIFREPVKNILRKFPIQPIPSGEAEMLLR